MSIGLRDWAHRFSNAWGRVMRHNDLRLGIDGGLCILPLDVAALGQEGAAAGRADLREQPRQPFQ